MSDAKEQPWKKYMQAPEVEPYSKVLGNWKTHNENAVADHF
jgi:hypothetical protein